MSGVCVSHGVLVRDGRDRRVYDRFDVDGHDGSLDLSTAGSRVGETHLVLGHGGEGHPKPNSCVGGFHLVRTGFRPRVDTSGEASSMTFRR